MQFIEEIFGGPKAWVSNAAWRCCCSRVTTMWHSTDLAPLCLAVLGTRTNMAR